MAMKRYSTYSRSSEIEPNPQMQFSVLLRTLLFFGGGLTQEIIFSQEKPTSFIFDDQNYFLFLSF